MNEIDIKLFNKYLFKFPSVSGNVVRRIIKKCGFCYREDECMCTPYQRTDFCYGPYKDAEHWKAVKDYKTKKQQEKLRFKDDAPF